MRYLPHATSFQTKWVCYPQVFCFVVVFSPAAPSVRPSVLLSCVSGSEGFRVSATSLINLWSLRGPLMSSLLPLGLSLSSPSPCRTPQALSSLFLEHPGQTPEESLFHDCTRKTTTLSHLICLPKNQRSFSFSFPPTWSDCGHFTAHCTKSGWDRKHKKINHLWKMIGIIWSQVQAQGHLEKQSEAIVKCFKYYVSIMFLMELRGGWIIFSKTKKTIEHLSSSFMHL